MGKFTLRAMRTYVINPIGSNDMNSRLLDTGEQCELTNVLICDLISLYHCEGLRIH